MVALLCWLQQSAVHLEQSVQPKQPYWQLKVMAHSCKVIRCSPSARSHQPGLGWYSLARAHRGHCGIMFAADSDLAAAFKNLACFSRLWCCTCQAGVDVVACVCQLNPDVAATPCLLLAAHTVLKYSRCNC